MSKNEMEHFCNKINKNYNMELKFFKFRNYSNKPTLDYTRFIQEAKEFKEKHPEALYIYDVIIPFAERIVYLIQNKENQTTSKKELDAYKFACYKTLKKEIHNSIPTFSIGDLSNQQFETAQQAGIRIGASVLLGAFESCTITNQDETIKTIDNERTM